jgi:ribosomal protein L40E
MITPDTPSPAPGDPFPDTADAEDAAPLKTELCLHCVTPHDPTADFCRSCGAPLTSFAATLPFERTLAEGFAYRQAVEQPRKLIVVAGIWFIFGLMGLTGFSMLHLTLPELLLSREGSPLLLLGTTLGGLAMLAVSAIIIIRCTMNFLRRKAEPAELAGEA